MIINEDLELTKKYQKEIKLLYQACGLLGWDEQVYMPKQGAEARAEQKALLRALAHEKMVSNEFFEALERLMELVDDQGVGLSEDDRIMVKRVYKDVLNSRKLPKKFIEELSKTESLAFAAWLEAREKNDFNIFKPHLEKIVELKRKQADYIGLEGHKYNSLLDDYEEGMTAEKLKPYFEKLKAGLVDLLQRIKSSEKYKNQQKILMARDFPKEGQMRLVKDVVERIGLKEEFSRTDFAEHPFTIGIGSNDTRITTNIRDDPMFAFGSSLHEAGHGLYELGYPKEHEFNFLGDAPGLGIHESQSRFWENMIGKSKAFWRFYFDRFDKEFNLIDSEKWYDEVNYVNPSFIRIESDEVHYCLHIILRFEIELGLIDGSIQVADLPRIWNEKMQELFGITPETDIKGVLQDVHWSSGSIGYFPTYALGSIYAAQLYNALKREMPDIEQDIERGDYERIKKWLDVKVHKHGRKMLAEDIIRGVCGEGLNIDAYLDYLNEKYGKIYGL